MKYENPNLIKKTLIVALLVLFLVGFAVGDDAAHDVTEIGGMFLNFVVDTTFNTVKQNIVFFAPLNALSSGILEMRPSNPDYGLIVREDGGNSNSSYANITANDDGARIGFNTSAEGSQLRIAENKVIVEAGNELCIGDNCVTSLGNSAGNNTGGGNILQGKFSKCKPIAKSGLINSGTTVIFCETSGEVSQENTGNTGLIEYTSGYYDFISGYNNSLVMICPSNSIVLRAEVKCKGKGGGSLIDNIPIIGDFFSNINGTYAVTVNNQLSNSTLIHAIFGPNYRPGGILSNGGILSSAYNFPYTRVSSEPGSDSYVFSSEQVNPEAYPEEYFPSREAWAVSCGTVTTINSSFSVLVPPTTSLTSPAYGQINQTRTVAAPTTTNVSPVPIEQGIEEAWISCMVLPEIFDQSRW
ncbi:MAG: hypothetical protein NUV57_00130 [archaeon]|nr:hypothetical protein [archaeon]